MTDVTIRWAGASDADVDTDYKIYSDETASGTFALITTANSTAPYAPVSTTLDGDIAASEPGDTISILFGSGTSFSNGDYVVIDREMFLLGGKSTNTFATCTGGQLGTIRQAHTDGTGIFKAHESYTDTTVDFTSRNVIRYRVAKLVGSTESIGAESVAVLPTNPPTNSFTTVWGILQDVQGNPKSGIVVTLAINQADNYHPGTSESMYQESETDTTDTDGYFQFFIPRDVDHAGGDMFTITIPAGTGGTERTVSITAVPDVDWVNF